MGIELKRTDSHVRNRRTNRTEHVLTTLILAMNAKEAPRVCPTIDIQISHDTLLKTLRRVPMCKSQSAVRELPSSITDFLPIDSNRKILVSSVQAMYKEGMSINAIDRSLHLNWRTVKKYSELGYKPLSLRRERSHSIDRYMNQVREYVMNHLTLKEIDHLLRGLGYKGSYGAIRYRDRDIRRGLLLENPLFLSRKDACRLLWQWPKKNEKDIVDVPDLLCEYPDLSTPFCFIQGFREAIRVQDKDELLRLIINPKVMSHPRLARFVRRLKKDLSVILAAYQYEENNGYVEGIKND